MHLDQMFGGLVILADAYGMGLTLHIFSEDINILATLTLARSPRAQAKENK